MVPSDSMKLILVYNQVGSRDNSFQTEKPGLYGRPPLHVIVDSGSKFTGVLLSLLKIKKGRGYGSMWPHGAYICILPSWKPRQQLPNSQCKQSDWLLHALKSKKALQKYANIFFYMADIGVSSLTNSIYGMYTR